MNVNNPHSSIPIIALCLFLLAHPSAPAQNQKSENFPPVEHASYHQLLFADEDFAVLNNLYPPGGDSGFHVHYREMFYVVIQPGQSSVQNLGKPLTEGPKLAAGFAAYGAMGGEPRVHRVVNGAASVLQFIVVELVSSHPKGHSVSTRENAKEYRQIVDNPRLRAWRLLLEPGQSCASISQGGKGIRIVVRGGTLTTTRPGVPDQVLALRAGDFSVQPAGSTRALTNSGTEAIEIVELELK